MPQHKGTTRRALLLVCTSLALACGAWLGLRADAPPPRRFPSLPAPTPARFEAVLHGEWGKVPGQLSALFGEGYPIPDVWEIDRNGRFVVVDSRRTDPRVQVFDAKGAFFKEIPLLGLPSISEMALDDRGHAFLTDGYKLWDLDLESGKAEELGSLRGMFAGIHALCPLAIARSDPDPAKWKRLLFIAQSLDTLEGTQSWVVGYGPDLKPWNGLPGRSPVAGPSGWLYVMTPGLVREGGTELTIKSWDHQAVYHVERTICLIPPEVKAMSASEWILVGVTENPTYFYIAVWDIGQNPPAHAVFKVDAQGDIVARILPDAALPPEVGPFRRYPWVDGQGNLYNSWGDRQEGFYIGKTDALAVPVPRPGGLPPPRL